MLLDEALDRAECLIVALTGNEVRASNAATLCVALGLRLIAMSIVDSASILAQAIREAPYFIPDRKPSTHWDKRTSEEVDR